MKPILKVYGILYRQFMVWQTRLSNSDTIEFDYAVVRYKPFSNIIMKYDGFPGFLQHLWNPLL